MDSWVRLSPLEEDCFGSVFLAMSSEGLPLVVKSSSSVEKCQSLQKEKSILENFHGCDEIIHCYGGSFSVEEGSRKYNLVLEYASRGCLRDLIRKYGGKIPESHAALYTKMILTGLYEIHKRKLVHCDLNPEKILVFTPEEVGDLSQLKIANFGLAKLPGEEEEQNQQRKFRGTLNYMSPEAIADGKIETTLDVWSLGCIVVEMMTGEKPWEEYNDDTVLLKIGTSKESPKVPNYLSEEAKDFVSKCFEVNHGKRMTIEMLLKHPFMVKKYERDASLPDCSREIYRRKCF